MTIHPSVPAIETAPSGRAGRALLLVGALLTGVFVALAEAEMAAPTG